MKRLYKTNADFKMFVDKFAKKHDMKINDVLKTATAKEYAIWLTTK